MVLQTDDKDDSASEAEFKASSVCVQLGDSAALRGKPCAWSWAPF